MYINKLVKHLKEISEDDYPVIRKKLFRILEIILSIFVTPLVFFILIFFRIISPLCLIRIGRMPTERIGHLAMNMEIYLCEKESLNLNKKKIYRYSIDRQINF